MAIHLSKNTDLKAIQNTAKKMDASTQLVVKMGANLQVSNKKMVGHLGDCQKQLKVLLAGKAPDEKAMVALKTSLGKLDGEIARMEVALKAVRAERDGLFKQFKATFKV